MKQPMEKQIANFWGARIITGRKIVKASVTKTPAIVQVNHRRSESEALWLVDTALILSSSVVLNLGRSSWQSDES